jgi:hypothetical protein
MIQTISKTFFFAIFLCMAFSASAQQAAIGRSLVGTIQLLDQDNQSVTIANNSYGYDESLFRVYYDGNEVPFSILNKGLVVRFNIDREGFVTRMELLGPNDKIRNYFEN